MRIPFYTVLLTMAIPLSAQTADTIYRQACGPQEKWLDVEEVSRPRPSAPATDKALVYFIQDSIGNRFTTRIGTEGAWVGVLRGDSFTALSVSPGEHHYCAFWQQHFFKAEPVFTHFTVEAGKTYYYLVRSINTAQQGVRFMTFTPEDRDEALFLISSSPQTAAKPTQ